MSDISIFGDYVLKGVIYENNSYKFVKVGITSKFLEQKDYLSLLCDDGIHLFNIFKFYFPYFSLIIM